MKTKEDYQYYRQYFIQLFGEILDDQWEQVLAASEILQIHAKQYLFHEGDKENSIYIVLSGRLRTLQQSDSTYKILGDVSAGEPVGEFAIFTNEPRTATVVAIRKSTVLKIDEAHYHELVKANPNFAHKITQFVINRLRRNAMQKRMNSAPKNIAIVKLQPTFDISPWTDQVKEELHKMNVQTQVYDSNNIIDEDHISLFDEIENNKGLNFLVCDIDHISWANQCVTYCDLILVVSDFNAASTVTSIEENLNLYESNISSKRIYLILLHPENVPMPTNTKRWFEKRNFNLHLHVRKNNAKDIRRFSRIIINKAVGLVLGGGGAKGFAHVGAVKAMLEAGIEFDFVGGTSAGALYGAGITYEDFDIDKVAAHCKRGAEAKVTSNDLTFPFISLMTGKKMRNYLHELFKDSDLEDFWVNTYCVSTNYSNATMKVHETGLTRLQIEASIAIPGVFPPVILDKHLHVDGGVMDNLPIEAMYQKPVTQVIAIALSAQTPHLVHVEKIPSAMELFINKFTKKHRYRLPRMSSLLINSLTLNSVQKQAITKSQVSLYLELNLGNFGFLDWSKWRELIDKGYQETKSFLEQQQNTEKPN